MTPALPQPAWSTFNGRLPVTFFLLALGCAAKSAEDEPPLECDPDARRGTYLVQYTELDGTCGPIPDAIIVTESRQDEIDRLAEDGCEMTTNRESEGGCRLDTVIECSDGSELAGYTIAQDGNADVIRGRVTLTGLGCRSTYDVTWTRE